MSRLARFRPVSVALVLPVALLMAAAPAASADVRVSVPPAVIGPADAARGAVAAGSDVDLRIPVWLAAGQPRAVVRLTAVGGRPRCAPRILRAGAVTTLTCRVRVSTSTVRPPRRLTVHVIVRSADGVLARRSFVREVGGRRV